MVLHFNVSVVKKKKKLSRIIITPNLKTDGDRKHGKIFVCIGWKIEKFINTGY